MPTNRTLQNKLLSIIVEITQITRLQLSDLGSFFNIFGYTTVINNKLYLQETDFNVRNTPTPPLPLSIAVSGKGCHSLKRA